MFGYHSRASKEASSGAKDSPHGVESGEADDFSPGV